MDCPQRRVVSEPVILQCLGSRSLRSLVTKVWRRVRTSQFSSDRSTNLIRSRKRIADHIYVGYYHPLSIIVRALRVIIRKSGTECVFSKFATRRFKLLQAHVAMDLIRAHHGLPTTVAVLRTRPIAMIGESEPPFTACPVFF